MPTTAASRDRKTTLFISYSRKDREFAEQLEKALNVLEYKVFRDVDEILPTEDWRSRLGHLIGQADTVIFVLSRSSLQSEVCHWEASYAHELKKRIAPVVIDDLRTVKVPPEIACLQYINFADAGSFQAALLELDAALCADIDWIREHTEIGERARRWDQEGRHISALLWGHDLVRAQRWVANQPERATGPDDLIRLYIARGERMAVLRQRLAIAAVILSLVFSIAIPTYFYPNQMYIAAMRWPSLYTVYKSDSAEINLWQSNQLKIDQSIASLQGTLARRFVEQREANDSSFTPWPVAQYAVALGQQGGVDGAFLEEYFRRRIDDSCGCWRETPEKPPHIGATSWVLYAMAERGLRPPSAPIEFLLGMQDGTGWWPIYPSTSEPHNASTYATAWAILTLTAQRPHLSDAALLNKIERATEAGTKWLMRTVLPQRARWYDYPSGSRKIEGLSVSALALHALHVRVASADLVEIDRLWLEELPPDLASASEFELTDAYVTLKTGALAFDRTRNYKMQWALIATIDAYQSGRALDKSRTMAWLGLMLRHNFIDADVLRQSWVASELVLALKHLKARCRETG